MSILKKSTFVFLQIATYVHTAYHTYINPDVRMYKYKPFKRNSLCSHKPLLEKFM